MPRSIFHVGYKQCQDNRIVKLRIDGENNEMREGVKRANKRFAKFRCAQALVLDIYNPESGEKFTSATSLNEYTFIYKVGEVVKPHLYDEDINKVCGGGIHYYLSEKAAIHYKDGHVIIERNSVRAMYNDDGTIDSHCDVKNGKSHGNYIGYHPNGKVSVKCTYVDGKLNGKSVSYFEDGIVNSRCTYVNNQLSGERIEYYCGSGKVRVKSTYANGTRCGEYKMYHESGRIQMESKYYRGVKMTTTWYNEKGEVEEN